jgi:hypothetical protein
MILTGEAVAAAAGSVGVCIAVVVMPYGPYIARVRFEEQPRGGKDAPAG